MTIDQWIARFKKAHIDEVDDAVHDAKSSEASRINNEGLSTQIAYLIEEIGESGLRELLPPQMRRVKMTVVFEVILDADVAAGSACLGMDIDASTISILALPSLTIVPAKIVEWETVGTVECADEGGSP